MAKRFLLKEFAKNANNNGVYGSYQNGNPQTSNDPEVIQSLPAWFTGWVDATTSGTLLPRLEEMQGVQKVLCEAIKENYREGVPEWIKGEEYYKNSVVSYSHDGSFNLYYNMTGGYTDQPPYEDTLNWGNLSTLFINTKYIEENYVNLNTLSNCLLKANDSTSSSNYNSAYVNFGTTIQESNISGFSPQRYVLLTKPFPSYANAQISDGWRIQTGNNVNAQQVLLCAPTIYNSIGIIDGKLYISLNGKMEKGLKPLETTKQYYLKLSWTASSVKLSVSEDNADFTEDVVFDTTEQAMTGKTVILGRGDTPNADTFFLGNMDFPVFKDAEGNIYWDKDTEADVNVIHFLGTFECLAPNGRDANNNLKNELYTELVDTFMLYNQLPDNGTKTIILTNKGELMAREKYTESETEPQDASLNSVWYDTKRNFMYQQSTEQPNFTKSENVQVNRGIVSAFEDNGFLYLDKSTTEERFDASDIVNLFEFEMTTGGSVSSGMNVATAEKGYYIDTDNRTINLNVLLQSYQVGKPRDDGGFDDIMYVNGKDYEDESGYITEGTKLYKTQECQSEESIDSPSLQYKYVDKELPSEFTIKVTSRVNLDSNIAYNIGVVCLDGKWTLMVGEFVDEYESYAQPRVMASEYKKFKIGFGLSDDAEERKEFNGTINLENTTFSGWKWNGVSSETQDWNQFIGCKIGTITQESQRITVDIDYPVELVKKVDIAGFQSQITKNKNDIDSLRQRVTTNEGNISGLRGRVTTNETGIRDLNTGLDNVNSTVSTIDGRVSTNETYIAYILQYLQSLSGGFCDFKTVLHELQQGDNYTMEENGFLYIFCSPNYDIVQCSINDVAFSVGANHFQVYRTDQTTVIPIAKGSVVKCTTKSGGNVMARIYKAADTGGGEIPYPPVPIQGDDLLKLKIMSVDNEFITMGQITDEALDKIIGPEPPEPPAQTIYAYRINESEPDPSLRVEYLESNSSFEPCKMNFDTDTFNWGDWANAFFIPKPCALQYDGTVDYYLNPNDFTKKANGGDSDVSDLDYEGNFMMEFPTIFVKFYKEDGYLYVYVSDTKVDDDYECWSCKNSDGSYSDHFYMPMFESTIDSSSRFRSVGTDDYPSLEDTTGDQEATYSEANGEGWYTTLWADEVLMMLLFPLLFKSTDSRGALGYGADIKQVSTPASKNNSSLAKGLMYGTKEGSEYGVTYLGLHNWWGQLHRRPNGLEVNNGRCYVKMTPSTVDGSKSTKFYRSVNRITDNYIDTDYTMKENKGNIATTLDTVGTYGIFPVGNSSGTETTYYCDECWINTKILAHPDFGGVTSPSEKGGIYQTDIYAYQSTANESTSASISYHPNAKK